MNLTNRFNFQPDESIQRDCSVVTRSEVVLFSAEYVCLKPLVFFLI